MDDPEVVDVVVAAAACEPRLFFLAVLSTDGFCLPSVFFERVVVVANDLLVI